MLLLKVALQQLHNRKNQMYIAENDLSIEKEKIYFYIFY